MPAVGPRFAYERLAADLVALIVRGALRPGDRVPSVRVMRRERALSHATVVKAYEVLHAQGWIVARPRSGYYVGENVTHRSRDGTSAGSATAGPSASPQARDVSITALMLEVVQTGSDPSGLPGPRAPVETRRQTRRLGDIARLAPRKSDRTTSTLLGAAVPETALLPAAAIGRALARAAVAGVTYAPSDGATELREAFARRALFWGGQLDPAEVIVTGGATEALALALRAVTRTGDVVAVESPTYFGVLHLLASLGLRVLELPTDPATGVRLEALAQALATSHADARVAACLLVPTFHNPTGALLPDAEKRALVRMLARHGVPLIEDDVYGELHHGLARPAACKAYDADGGVLYVSSVSKTLAPGFRVGLLAAGRYTERVRFLKAAGSLSSPTATQRAVSGYMASGAFDRHLRRLRKELAANVIRARTLIAEVFPTGTVVSEPAGGLVLWLQLPDASPVDAAVRLYHAARAEHIGIAPGPIFSPAGTTEAFGRAFRLNIAVRWRDDVVRALMRLGALAAIA